MSLLISKPPKYLVFDDVLDKLGLCVHNDLRSLFCFKCRAFVSSTGVWGHLRSTSHKVDAEHVPPVSDSVLQATLLKHNISGPLPPPPTIPVPPINGLPVVQVLECNVCHTRVREYSHLKRHYSHHHLDITIGPLDSFRSLRCQRFHANCPYFEVLEPTPASYSDESPSPDIKDTILHSFSSYHAEVHSTLWHSEAPAEEVEPYLRRTRWLDLVAGHDGSLLALSSYLPSDNPLVKMELRVGLALFKKYEDMIDEVHPTLLRHFASETRTDGSTSNTPLGHLQSSADVYAKTAISLVHVLLDPPSKFHMNIPQDLRALVHEYDLVLHELCDGETAEIFFKAENKLGEIFVRLWMSDAPFHPAKDPSQLFVMFRSLDRFSSEPSFKKAKDITSILAHLSRSIRLVVLSTSFHYAKENGITIEEAALSFIRFVREGTFTPYDRIRFLQHMLTSAAMEVTSDSATVWTDDSFLSMTYKGNSISLSDVNSLIHKFMADAASLLQSKLLFSKDLQFSYTSLPHDLTNTTPSYSFLTDARSPNIALAKSALIKAVLDDPSVRDQFFISTDQSIALNHVKAYDWMCNYATFQTLLITIVWMNSGGLPRIPELAHLLLLNTGGRNSSVTFVECIAVLLRRYSKTSSMTGKDKFIPSQLDNVTSDLLVQDLVILRPFATYLASKIFGNKPDINYLYSHILFVNGTRRFETRDVSSLLSSATSQLLGWPLTVQSGRQVIHGFHREHCPQYAVETSESPTLSPFPDDTEHPSDDSVAPLAMAMGHSVSANAHHYSVTASSSDLGLSERRMVHLRRLSTHGHLIHRTITGITGGIHHSEVMPAMFDEYLSLGAIPSPITVPSPRNFAAVAEQLLEIRRSHAASKVQFVDTEKNLTTKLDAFRIETEKKLDRLLEWCASADVTIAPPSLEHPLTPVKQEPFTPDLFPPRISRLRSPVQPALVSSVDPKSVNSGVEESLALSASVAAIPVTSEDDEPRTLFSKSPSGSSTFPSPSTAFHLTRTEQQSPSPAVSQSRSIPRRSARRTNAISEEEMRAIWSEALQASETKPSMQSPPVIASSTASSAVNKEDIDISKFYKPSKVRGYAPTADALAVIRAVKRDPAWKWKSEHQMELLSVLLDNQRDIICAMGTGAGKSLPFEVLHVFEPHAATVLYLPFRAVYLDSERKFEEAGVPFHSYSSKNSTIDTRKSLVLCSIESAEHTSLRQALSSLETQKPILRSGLDECQELLIGTSYRQSLTRAHSLRWNDSQLFALSGSLPVQAESTIAEMLAMENPVVIRSRSSRPELRLDIRPIFHDQQSLFSFAKELVQQYLSRLSEEERIIVYSPYVDEGRHLAALLNCFFFGGPADNAEIRKGRDASYRSWYDGTGPNVIVGTTALGAGISHPHVRAVIHVMHATDVLTYVQQIGRAGRDGKPADCILLPLQTSRRRSSTNESQDLIGQSQMQDIVFAPEPYFPKRCIRYAVSYFIDGEDLAVYCLSHPGKVERCSRCREASERLVSKTPLSTKEIVDPPSSSSLFINEPQKDRASIKRTHELAFGRQQIMSRDRKAKSAKRMDALAERYLSPLKFFQAFCPACFLTQKSTDRHRNIRDCPVIKELGWDAYVDFKASLRYTPGTCCYYCGVPALGDRLHAVMTGGPGNCDYSDIAAVIAFVAYKAEPVRSALQAFAGINFSNDNMYSSWLVRKPVTTGYIDIVTNLMMLVVWAGENRGEHAPILES